MVVAISPPPAGLDDASLVERWDRGRMSPLGASCLRPLNRVPYWYCMSAHTVFPCAVSADQLFERAFDNLRSGSDMQAPDCGLLHDVWGLSASDQGPREC